MRILTVTSCFPRGTAPELGTQVFDRVRALGNRGAEIHVISPVPWVPPGPVPRRLAELRATPQHEEYDGFAVRRPRVFTVGGIGIRFQAFGYTRGIRSALAEEIAAFRPEVIDVHNLYPDGVAVLAAARQYRIPVAVTAQGGDVKVLARLPAIRERIEDALPSAAAVIAVSNDLANELSGQRLFAGDVTAIANGVDPDLFHPRPRASARAELGWPELGRHLLCIGRLDGGAGQKLLLAALAAQDAPDDVVVHFLGDGPDRRRLERLARAMGLADRVTFQGRVSREQVPVWIAASDATVGMSRLAGSPTAVLESLACGIPVLAPDIPAFREVVNVGRDGLLVPLDISGTARGLCRLLEQEWSVPTTSRRTWNEVADEILILFDSVRRVKIQAML